MALSTRGKTLVGVLAVIVLAGGAFIGYRLLTKEPGEPIIPGVPIGQAEPVLCPLLGEEAPNEEMVERPALAVKIENIAEARPQVGLAEADVIWEEEAEGGITRFIVTYHCHDADRLGPVRSARPVDPPVLVQLGEPLFGYAGGVARVDRLIAEAGIVDLNYVDAAQAYTRDPNKSAPHDLYSSTQALRKAGRKRGTAPEALFTYDEEPPSRQDSAKGRTVHTNFSPAADVTWRYRRGSGEYVRFHDTEPHTLEDGSQVSVKNLVVMVVRRLSTRITDPAGNPVPNFKVTGRGEAYIFRDGRVIEGKWLREDEGDLTRFETSEGEEIPLAPGRTWISLFPNDAPTPIEF